VLAPLNGTTPTLQHPSSAMAPTLIHHGSTANDGTPPPNPCAMPVPHNGTTLTSHHLASPVATPLSNRESHNHYGL
jgi:hypothetical protein